MYTHCISLSGGNPYNIPTENGDNAIMNNQRMVKYTFVQTSSSRIVWCVAILIDRICLRELQILGVIQLLKDILCMHILSAST